MARKRNNKGQYQKYGKAHYEKNKKAYVEKAKKNKAVEKQKWAAFKATLSCTQCGEGHPAALDFHHIKRSRNNIKVHVLVKDGRFKKAYEEIKKCLVLCANCHRKLHYKEYKKTPALGGGKTKETCQDNYITQSSKSASPSACLLLRTYK
jgi:cytochrome c553